MCFATYSITELNTYNKQMKDLKKGLQISPRMYLRTSCNMLEGSLEDVKVFLGRSLGLERVPLKC